MDPASITRRFGVLDKARVPLRPHFGMLAVAPREAGLIDSIPPSYFGGNLDNWRAGKGATLFLPVSVPGALFSVALVDVWKGVGLATLIYIAGLAAISPDYYEAARIDGITIDPARLVLPEGTSPLVVEGAGGMMADWQGNPLDASSDGTVIALGDPARLEDVLEAMG